MASIWINQHGDGLRFVVKKVNQEIRLQAQVVKFDQEAFKVDCMSTADIVLTEPEARDLIQALTEAMVKKPDTIPARTHDHKHWRNTYTA